MLSTQVLFPVLMIAGVCRTMLVRVYSNVVVEFRRLANIDTQGRGLISRSTNELRNGGSLFGWADKGRWHTVPTSDEGLRRERNWFRIGFEPLFVTFTHSAAWFTVVFLVEVSRDGLCKPRFINREGSNAPTRRVTEQPKICRTSFDVRKISMS